MRGCIKEKVVMQRFKKYIGMGARNENIRNTGRFSDFGITSRYIPDSIGDFDECEFLVDPEKKDIVLCVAILEGKIKRIMFIQTDQIDPDAVRPLTESELGDMLGRRGDRIVAFFEYITE